MKRLLLLAMLVPALILVASEKSRAATVTVEITNITHGIYFTPLLVTAHGSTDHLFELGTAASVELQAMAEGGAIDDLTTALGGADADTVANPAEGPLAPGATATAVLDTGATGNTHLSVVAMLLPTNDGFVGLDSLEIPTTSGTTIYFLNGYDAGTEANDELLNLVDGGVPGTPGIPADPTGEASDGGSGVATTDNSTVVHIHRGNLGDTDTTAGLNDVSDLDATVHRWLNPVALLRVTVE